MNALDLQAEYTVRYRNVGDDLVVFTYDRGSRVLVPQGYDQLVYIERQTDREAWVLKDQYVMFMDDTGLISVGEFSNRFRPLDFPRLDFCRQYTDTPEVIASLHTNGRLCVPNAFELDVQLDGTLMIGDGSVLDIGQGNAGASLSESDQMIFFGRIVFNRLGLYAVKMEEIGLLNVGDGGYLEVGGQGQLLQL